MESLKMNVTVIKTHQIKQFHGNLKSDKKRSSYVNNLIIYEIKQNTIALQNIANIKVSIFCT